MSNICTVWDVKKNTPMDPSFPDDSVCPNISRIERVAFAKCFLGLDMYTSLKADLNSTDLELWDPDVTYANEAKVIYDGEFYCSTKADNLTSPEDGDWSLMEKFKSKVNNDLWNEGGLKYWLGLMIFYGCMKYTIYKNGAKGLLKIDDDNAGGKTVSLEEYRETKKGIKHDADDQLELLRIYLQPTGGEGCDGEQKCKPRKRRRRFHFIDD